MENKMETTIGLFLRRLHLDARFACSSGTPCTLATPKSIFSSVLSAPGRWLEAFQVLTQPKAIGTDCTSGSSFLHVNWIQLSLIYPQYNAAGLCAPRQHRRRRGTGSLSQQAGHFNANSGKDAAPCALSLSTIKRLSTAKMQRTQLQGTQFESVWASSNL